MGGAVLGDNAVIYQRDVLEAFGCQGRTAQVHAKFSLAFTSRPKTIIDHCNDKVASRIYCHVYICNAENPHQLNVLTTLSQE